MIFPHIIQLAALCSKSGVSEAILSPGSRCAPISLAFIRQPEIHCRIIPDERSAAFMALGMAQQLNKPVVLVCTSGSASLNYAPAVAEAYFQQVPLLIFTADRPPEWIDQWDGQTIRQNNIYGQHVKGSFQLPDSMDHPDKTWHAKRIVKEAIALSKAFPMGPVHINVPIREPFYPDPKETFSPVTDELHPLEIINAHHALNEDALAKIKHQLATYRKVLIVPGQQKPNEHIRQLLEKLVEDKKAVVITDVISNLAFHNSISHHDFFLKEAMNKREFEPDLVISFGKSIISKALKLFLRSTKASHWHLQTNGYVPDTYQIINGIVPVNTSYFLEYLLKVGRDLSPEFVNSWQKTEITVSEKLPEIMEKADFGEFQALYTLIRYFPENSKIHLANSMAVRYANFLGIRGGEREIVCNRGTSGIDGSNSTAVGCVFTTKDTVTLITGDMAFFYDRNAFWHKYNLNNLRIILFNNHGGGIFRMIDGPSNLPEFEEYFETHQELEAAPLARELDFEYHRVSTADELKTAIGGFYKKSLGPKILEVVSDSKRNTAILKGIQADIKEYLVR